MAGLSVLLFALYLAAALLAKTPPKDAQRYATMLAFAVLIPAVLTQRLPLTLVPLLSLFLAAYLRRAR